MSRQRRPSNWESHTRRAFFEHVGAGFAGIALASLVNDDLLGGALSKTGGEAGTAVPIDLAARRAHFGPRARSVIHLFMNGGPSQMDLFDPKPELTKRHGQAYFDQIAG
ncbi:MAG: DUF1501 domain-containing protein, partial [Pirellulales bacterium]